MTSPTEPIRVSWSMLRAHEECRQKTALLRQGKRVKAQDLRNFFGGMVVDSVMRDWLANPDRARTDMRTMIDDYIDRGQEDAVASGDGVVRWRGTGDREQLREFAVELVHRLDPILHEHVLGHTYICGNRFTHPLTLPDGTDVLLTGEMDLFVQLPGGWAVWDLKGTKDDSYWRKVLGQLVFYTLAAKLETGDYPILTGLIQPMCKQPVLTFDIDAEARRQMLVRILRYVDDVKTANDTCREDTTGCSRCEVSHACKRYTPTPGTNTLSLGASMGAALRDAAKGTAA